MSKLKTLKDFEGKSKEIESKYNKKLKKEGINGEYKITSLVDLEDLRQEAIKWIKSKSHIIKPVFGENNKLLWAVMPQDNIGIDTIFNLSELKGAITEKIRFYNITEEDLK